MISQETTDHCCDELSHDDEHDDASEDDFLESLAFDGEQKTGRVFSRRNYRALVFHLLYAAEAFGYDTSLEAIVDNYGRGFGIVISKDSDIFVTARAIIEKKDELDKLYEPLLANWRFDRISVSTKLILRLATYEIIDRSIDHRIIINEAVELAKRFAEQDAYKFINGILDKLAKQYPPLDAKPSDTQK